MQHQIDAERFGLRGEAMARAVQACVHCGWCLSPCPTYQILGEEMDSPRGRIYLMKDVLEGSLVPADVQPYLDRCLGCGACIPACPAGVAYDELMGHYRMATRRQTRRRWQDAARRKLLASVLPYPGRLRALLAAARLGRAVPWLLPTTWRNALELLPPATPPVAPLPDVFPAHGRRRARVALLTGCLSPVVASQINWATLRVLARQGVETVVPAAQGCCGALPLQLDEAPAARRLARQNLRVFPPDVDAILTSSADCGAGIRDYPLLFAGEADQAQAEAFATRVSDVCVFLDRLGWEPPASLPMPPRGDENRGSAPSRDRQDAEHLADRESSVPTLSSPLRVVIHDACYASRARDLAAAQRRLLAALPNIELVAGDDGDRCCGAAGVYNLLQPDIARQLGERQAAAIAASGADAVVTGSISCLLQLQVHLRRQGHNLPVYHPLTLLHQA